MDCYECGERGHIASACPNAPYLTEGAWCGYCDERTRLIDLGDTVRRCTACHPERGRQLKQHRKCPGCNSTVFAWDNAPCGSHQRLGPKPHTALAPARGRPHDLRALALQQAAEARAARMAFLDEPGHQQDPAHQGSNPEHAGQDQAQPL
jgi:Zinc knuckle